MKIPKTRRSFLVAALFIFTLYGCDAAEIEKKFTHPLPPDKLDYEGHWETAGMTLIITREGGISYEKIGDGGSKVSINGPIKEFENDNFVVGFWILTTTFEVQEPPHEEDGRWVMVVDGTKLYKREFGQENFTFPPSPGTGA